MRQLLLRLQRHPLLWLPQLRQRLLCRLQRLQPWPVAVLPVVLTWAAPGVLWLLEGGDQLGGRAGRHE